MNKISFTCLMLFSLSIAAFVSLSGCSAAAKESPVEENKKLYTHVWDEVMNKGNLNMINDSNFTQDAVIHASPEKLKGVESIKAYYNEFLVGFSNIKFTMTDVIGEGEKLVKTWNFQGTHTGVFFGIPATGKQVSLDGSTVVRMENGKIAEERDYFDNMEFMTQLGLLPPAGQ
jgi:uncharacterized protein